MFDNAFQATLITLFIVFAVAGVAIFAINPGLYGGGEGGGPQTVSVTVWGTVDADKFSQTMSAAGVNESESLSVSYEQVNNGDLRNQLVNALARNRGPDALLLPHTQLLQLEEFLTRVGSETYNPRKFRRNFVEGAEVFSSGRGIAALPFAADPLLLYWNRDMLSSAGFVSPPETWSQMSRYVEGVSEIDQQKNISQSAVALGTANSISQSKEILSTLFMQAGNPIVTRGKSSYKSTLTEQKRSAEAAVRLYTQYANPSADSYAWNSSLGSAERAFSANRTAMYFDTGQSVNEVRNRNPNLNFDVSLVPQRQDGERRTYATMYGLALLDHVSAGRKGAVFSALQRLTQPEVARAVLEATNLTPVHKQVVANADPQEPYKATLLDSAVIARGWLDPNPQKTTVAFDDMIRDVTSGRRSVGSAVNIADQSLQKLFDQ